MGGDDDGVVEEPVQEADGGGVFGEEPAPVLERPVRRDAERASFVGAGDEPEEQLGAGVVWIASGVGGWFIRKHSWDGGGGAAGHKLQIHAHAPRIARRTTAASQKSSALPPQSRANTGDPPIAGCAGL